MGRRITSGILPGGIGQLAITTNTITSVETDDNLILTTDGTGIVQIQKSTTLTSGNLTINAQGDLRLADSDSSDYVAVRAAGTTTSYTITMPSAVSTRNGFVMYTDTSGNLNWGAADPYRGTYSVQATSFAAAAFNAYFVNTSSSGVTATLPASATTGDTIRFFDLAKTFDSNAFTVARNGHVIQGDAADLTVNTEGAAFELVYSNATYGWRIFTV